MNSLKYTVLLLGTALMALAAQGCGPSSGGNGVEITELPSECPVKGFAEETAAGKVVTHPVPQGIYYSMHNDDFTVRVRPSGGEWVELYEYKVIVDMDSPSEASMVNFDFSGEVELMVKKNNGSVRKAEIRPLSKGIRPRRKGNTVIFKMDRPCNLSVEFDGDKHRNLHVFTNPIETDVPAPPITTGGEKDNPAPPAVAESKTDAPTVVGKETTALDPPAATEGNRIGNLDEKTAGKSEACGRAYAESTGLIYFGPGVYEPEEEEGGFSIPSDTRVYLAPGAVVKGSLICENVQNVHIGGRGILLTPFRGITISNSEDITVEDIIIVDPRHYSVLGGQSRGIEIRNLRSFSYQGWSDGIDLMSCSNVHVDGVFMRNSDDCIAVYGPRWDYRGDSRDILVENSALWADIAHPINMGIHGYTGDGIGSMIEDITFRNIDILEHDEDDPPYEGCMAICCGDMNLIRGILYEDIRVERVEEGQLFHFEVVFNEKYCTAPGRGIDGVTLRNVRCAAIPDLHPSSIEGYDSTRLVRNVQFENVRIGARRLRSASSLRTNPYIENITFD